MMMTYAKVFCLAYKYFYFRLYVTVSLIFDIYLIFNSILLAHLAIHFIASHTQHASIGLINTNFTAAIAPA